jgi:hypothetical protein
VEDGTFQEGHLMRSATTRPTSFIRLLILACPLLFTAADAAGAQSTFATLTGTVTDASGAVLPGVTITATNTATQSSRTAVTDDVGSYLLPSLDAGVYRIVASLAGFSELTRETELLARQTVRVDLQMQIAGAREQVEVVAASPVVETERATIDTSKSGDEINKLALNFRATTNTSPIVVATLAPGVQQDTNGAISIAGNLPYMTSFSVDGVAIQNTRGGGPMRDLLPSVESIEEFKVTEAGNNAGDRHHDDDEERDERPEGVRILVQSERQVRKCRPVCAARYSRPANQAATQCKHSWGYGWRPYCPEPDVLLRYVRRRAAAFRKLMVADRPARRLPQRRPVERDHAARQSVYRPALPE